MERLTDGVSMETLTVPIEVDYLYGIGMERLTAPIESVWRV